MPAGQLHQCTSHMHTSLTPSRIYQSMELAAHSIRLQHKQTKGTRRAPMITNEARLASSRDTKLNRHAIADDILNPG